MNKNNDAPVNAGGKERLLNTEQGVALPADTPSVGKFADATVLLNAYNELQSEFTKRSQRLRELERENELLRQEQVGMRAESEVVQDETGSAAEERAHKTSCVADERIADADENIPCEDDRIADEVGRFLSENPEAGLYADEIVDLAAACGEVEKGFLERAYLKVVKGMLERERERLNDGYVLERARSTPAVRDEIIRGYLADVHAAKGMRLLTGEGGASSLAPPLKPSSIAEAGEMARSVLRKK